MVSPSGSRPAPEPLAAALAPALGGPVEVGGLRRLTGGASRETWAFTANGVELILRRDPPGRPGPPGGMRREAEAMRACHRAGLRVPEVLVDDDGSRLGTAGLVMRRVAGETIPRRLLRDDRFTRARSVLVADLGRFLAGLHALDPAEVLGPAGAGAAAAEVGAAAAPAGAPGAGDGGVPDPLAQVWAEYERVGDRSEVFERAHARLLATRPPRRATTLVHGDLRLGNLIVDEDGLAAVIDWELLHAGDPLEDLAWLCVKAWRFGARPEVAGMGALDELIGAYEAAGGRPVDRDALAWWLAAKTLTWGIVCMVQADVHLSGRLRSVELAAIGRRVAEQEWDLLELLAPEAWRAARAAPAPPAPPPGPAPYGRPRADELVGAVRGFLTEEVMASDDRALAFRARVAANALAVVERELGAAPPRAHDGTWEALALTVRDRLAVANPAHLTAPGP